jgi:putative serine protease PepD
VRRAAAGGVAVLAIASAGFTAGRTTAVGPASASSSAAAVATLARSATVTASTASEPVAAAAAIVSSAVVQLETASGLGSGVVYDDSGHILTAAHVVSGVSDVTVRFADGTTLPGHVVGADTMTDIAVVSVTLPSGVVPAQLATGVDLAVGQLAVAIGSPFGLDQTVTAGIVSAIDRTVQGMTVVQTDAAINPGNSGGPLVDARGRVIGINNSIYSQSGDNAGVGFAVPVDIAAEVARQLVAGQGVQLAQLGVSTAEPTSGRGGALVRQVTAGSAADAGGIQAGDLIVAIGGAPVTSSSSLQGRVLAHQPGERLQVEIVRGGATLTRTITLGRGAR